MTLPREPTTVYIIVFCERLLLWQILVMSTSASRPWANVLFFSDVHLGIFVAQTPQKMLLKPDRWDYGPAATQC